MSERYITVLSIAGSDSIGGAGIQADIKTCCASGIYAMTAITAVTAQNTMGVKMWEAVSPWLLKAQLDAVSEDITPDAVKIGMIPNAESAAIIADWLVANEFLHVVVDPVMVATSGDALSDSDTKEILTGRIFPLAELVTPNLPELTMLTGCESSNLTDITQAVELLKRTTANVLVKGGHGSENEIMDLLVTNDGDAHIFRHARLDTKNTHGTGCSLSTAIASNLARQYELTQAVEDGINQIYSSIMLGMDIVTGRGNGPINHMLNNACLRTYNENYSQ